MLQTTIIFAVIVFVIVTLILVALLLFVKTTVREKPPCSICFQEFILLLKVKLIFGTEMAMFMWHQKRAQPS